MLLIVHYIISSLLIIFGTNVKIAKSANILGLVPTPSLSHQVVFQPIWRELSLRGHKVTVITTDPLNDKSLVNLTEIDCHFSYEVMKKVSMYDRVLLPDEIWKVLSSEIIPLLMEDQMNHPEVMELMNDPNVHFDLVISEFILNPMIVFSYKFHCPLVGLTSITDFPNSYWALGNPFHPHLNPTTYNDFSNPFLQRLWNVYIYLRIRLRNEFETKPEWDATTRKYFGNDIPYIGDIERNVSLILATQNFITSKPKPKVPTFIELGYLHIKKNVSLPDDLKSELDKETNGMIYFSLGSNVQSARLTENLRNVFLDAFSELPFKVLWKWETDFLPNKPNNVIIRKWLPQEGVLAHPNVKVFVTQGGLQSMEEAIYYKKPLVGIPFFGDQHKNVKRMSETGIGLELDFQTLTKHALKSAILEVFQNKKYVDKISELSDAVRDQPMNGLETAIWWIEYVIRHKGAKNLRSPLLDLPYYQYLLIDVIGFVLLIFGIMVLSLYHIANFLKSSSLGHIKDKTL